MRVSIPVTYVFLLVSLHTVVAGCGSDDPVHTSPTTVVTPSSTSTPTPTASPTPEPLFGTVRETVIFESGSLEARGAIFTVAKRGAVEVGVGCHQSFTPFQMTKVDLLANGEQRVVSQRCGPASPTCADIGLALDLEPGVYSVHVERHTQYRTFAGYACGISVTYPR